MSRSFFISENSNLTSALIITIVSSKHHSGAVGMLPPPHCL